MGRATTPRLDAGGFSLVGVLIAVAISSVVLLVLANIAELSVKQQSQSSVTFNIDQLRKNLRDVLNNPTAWQNTIKASDNSPPYTHGGADFTAPPSTNAGLNCLIGSGSNCTDSSGNPITDAPFNRIRDANGAVVFDALAQNGITMQGTPCNSFVNPPGAGNDQCPFSLRVTWSAVCGASCSGADTSPEISVIPVYNPAPASTLRINLNPDNYKLKFRQGGADNCWLFSGGVLIDRCPGYIGIGTNSPVAAMDVRSVDQHTTIHVVNFSDSPNPESAGGVFTGYRLRGTPSSPQYPLANDRIAEFSGANPLTEDSFASMRISAAENQSAAAQGKYISFHTTRNGSTNDVEAMRIAHNGFIGIGTTNPQSLLHVSDTGATRLTAQSISGISGVTLMHGAGVPLWAITDGFGVYDGNLNFISNTGVGPFPRIVVTPTGRVGIGNMPPAHSLDVAGDVNISASGNLRFGGASICTSAGCVTPSDNRLKENIVPLQGALEKILKLQGVVYEWRDKENFGGSPQIGLIAQDLEKVYPEVVHSDEKTTLRTVAYAHLVAPLIEAVKELHLRWLAANERTGAEIENLKHENTSLRAQNRIILRRLEALERRNQETGLPGGAATRAIPPKHRPDRSSAR